MLVLGIETSCDETAVSVLRDGKYILSSLVSTQEEIHRKYGGVVPELACRRHIEVIYPLITEALNKAKVGITDIDCVAVTYGPGLIGALLVGVSIGKAIAYALKIPLVAVNHIEGHIMAILLEEEIFFPFISLIVSGGHTQLYYVKGVGDYEFLGSTLDDAAGEAYDKVAKMLGLGYPGGPIIDQIAKKGNPNAIRLPRALSGKSLDFSFSGLKTAVLNHINSLQSTVNSSHSQIPNIAASFQQAVVDVLVRKTIMAAEKKGVGDIVLGGGVACNSALREQMVRKAASRGMAVHIPSPSLCTDNAAMIALAGYYKFKKKEFAPLTLNPQAHLSI